MCLIEFLENSSENILPYWSIAQSPSADLLQTSNRTIATCLYSLPSLLKGRFINHPSIMSNGIWGNLLLKKRRYFWQLYIVDIHSWPCICVHVLLNNISAWCCSMLAWCGEREMNVGWDQIGGMYACIYHFIFLHAFLHDTAIHAVSNIRKTNFCQKVRHVIFL